MLSVCVAPALPLPGVLPAYVFRPILCSQECSLSVHFLYPVCLVYSLLVLSEGLLWPGMLPVCASPISPLPAVLPAYVLRGTLCDLACSLSVHLFYPICLVYCLPMFSEGPSMTWHAPCLFISCISLCLPYLLPAYVLRRTPCGLACPLSVHLFHPVCLVYCQPMLSEGPSVAGHFPCLCISCSPSVSFTPCTYSVKPQDPSAKQF